jgi:hypothetical protein
MMSSRKNTQATFPPKAAASSCVYRLGSLDIGLDSLSGHTLRTPEAPGR